MRKYLNYVIFGAVVLLVVGIAVNHSRHMRYLVDSMASGSPEQRRAAADELIKSEQFMDAITGEPIQTRVQAAKALDDLGTPEAVKQCIAFLKDPDKPVRDAIVKTLEDIGARSADSIKELAVGLKDGDPNVRNGTVLALTDAQGGIGPKPGVVAAVVDIMKREAGARGPGGDVLGSPLFRQDGGDKESVPALLALLKNSDEGVRTGAADALGKIGDPAAVPALVTAMHSDTAQVRRVAIGAIALIADRSGEAALEEAVRNPQDDAEARSQAAAGLGKIATPSAVQTLIAALDDDDLKLRSAASAALARAARPTVDGPVDGAVLASLTGALRSQLESVRRGAATALATAEAPQADPALIAALRDTDPTVREAAARALGFPNNTAAVQPLIAALSDTDPYGRVTLAARDSLAAIGKPATDALIAAMQRGGTDAYYASQALAREGTTVVAELQQVARGPNTVGQRWAAVALGDIGGSDARPTLEQLEKSKDPDVAYVARQQLDRMGSAQ